VFSAAVALLRGLGELLDRRHIARYCAILLAIELAVAAFFVAGTYGLITPLDQPISTDFVSFYAAGKLAVSGTPELAYDQAVHHAAEQAATQAGIPYNYFYYPPVFLLLCAGLALLPYLTAFFVFETATLALYLLVATAILRERRWTALLVLAAFPPLLWNFGYGQNAFLTAALFGGGTLLIDRRPVLAGLLFGALCYKPHFGLLIPVALAAGGHWRAFAAAGLSVVGLVLLSALLFGGETWHHYLATVIGSTATYETGRVNLAAFVTPFGGVLVMGGTPRLAYAVQAIATLAAIALVAIVWARRLPLPIRAATLASATLAAIPVALIYDLMLATIAAAWLYRAESGISPARRGVLAVLFAACLCPAHLFDAVSVPVSALVTLALLIVVAWHARHEAACERQTKAEEDSGRLEPARAA
jgi:alpha-1,2-mannosyltransferase